MFRATLLCHSLIALIATASASGADGYRSLFDGETLGGWSAPDMRYWSVEDGAITARSSDAVPCTKNQFLVWQRGELDDFELKLKFRILGSDRANSGIQIRSQIANDGHAVGYQADIDRSGQWLGALYDEHTGRRGLAARGKSTSIAADGKRTESTLDLSAFEFEKDGWNDYHITARGPRIELRINGTLTAVVVDEEAAHRDAAGRLALQIHSGPPMTVQFKDIALKRLKLDGGRKKIVLVAGAPSHASGEHEFNAGVKILARRLKALDTVVAASYHDSGWPKDPSAFDNADGIIVYSDGNRRHPIESNFEEMDKILARGVGLMCMHYAVEVGKGERGEFFRKWIGGYYEHEYSSNPHWKAELKVTKDHPIARGVAEGSIHDEWYFCIRFRDEMKGVTSILRAKPSDKTRAKNGYPPRPYPHIVAASGRVETLMWGVERPDGGRGVGFTGGHWHRNWAYDLQRRAVLNAILWVSGAKVPEGGVDSEVVTVEELNANLDKKRKIKTVALPDGLEKPE